MGLFKCYGFLRMAIASLLAAMPERRLLPLSRRTYFGGDPLAGEVSQLDEPVVMGNLEQSPHLSKDSIWIELVAIGAVLTAGLLSGLLSLNKLF